MTVAQLIERLRTCDPEGVVYVWNGDDDNLAEAEYVGDCGGHDFLPKQITARDVLICD